jgi:hypothetical protein
MCHVTKKHYFNQPHQQLENGENLEETTMEKTAAPTPSAINPLIDVDHTDTMSNVAEVLTFISVAIICMSEASANLTPSVASGMSSVLKCCTKALNGG